jgi:two-component system, NarL family, response regulator NreC
MEKIKVLVVDDHPMLRGGIISLLNGQDDIEVVGEAANGAVALNLMEHQLPDVVVMDININGVIDTRSTEEIKKRWPVVKVVAFSMHNEAQVIRKMLKAGASAYLTKSAAHDELISAIHAVMNGEVYYDSQVIGVMTEVLTNGQSEPDGEVVMSSRESEVLYYVSKEFTNQEMAERMDISLRTVETHKRNLIKKLRVKNVVGLVRYAMENGHLFER